MQGEVHPLDLDLEIPLQFFNTPGTEITPRSNVIGKDLQRDRLGHRPASLAVHENRIATIWRVAGAWQSPLAMI
jgi:hypothetical protein